jgi:hypothetical protein
VTRCFSLLTPIRERWAVANCWPGHDTDSPN